MSNNTIMTNDAPGGVEFQLQERLEKYEGNNTKYQDKMDKACSRELELTNQLQEAQEQGYKLRKDNKKLERELGELQNQVGYAFISNILICITANGILLQCEMQR